MANKKWWDGLKPEQQKVIAASVKQSVTEQRAAVTAQVDEGVKFLKANGVAITEVDKAKFAEATKDVPSLVADQVPPALVQRIRETR
jgi:TRAP-type C4-dicarboxylate transport system substrate-binding protein